MARSGLVNPNPALERGFKNLERTYAAGTETMTINGTVGITGLLLFFVVAAAAFSWTNLGMGAALIGALVGFGLAIFTVFKPMKAQITAIPYAIAEGIFLGGISRNYNNLYDGIAIQAAGLTIAILFAMLLVYRSGLIKVDQNFKIAVAAATMGVALIYLVTIGLSFFGIQMPLVNSNDTFGIIFSLVVIAIASASLAVDFDFIETGAEQGLPKQMEWYGAFGLIVTLVWLYLELLRLLSKLQSR